MLQLGLRSMLLVQPTQLLSLFFQKPGNIAGFVTSLSGNPLAC